MKKSIIWVIGLGLAGLYLLTRRSLAKNLVFNFSDIKFKGTVLKPIIQVTFSVQNPTNQKAILKGVAGTLSFNGSPVSNISNFTEQTIAAKTESFINIDVRPSLLGIASSFIDAIRGKRITGSFSFDGSANVDGIVLPINQKYDL
jgi:hypothetical protein